MYYLLRLTNTCCVWIHEKEGISPVDFTTDETCGSLLQSHATIFETVDANPALLVIAAAAHYAALSGSEESGMGTALSLGESLLEPSFLWAPPSARAAVFEWARNVAMVKFATTTDLLVDLSNDCIGDVLEFLIPGMPRKEYMDIFTLPSLPEAYAWVHAIVAAAYVVSLEIIMR